MIYLEKLEEARKKLKYTDETEKAIAADKKLQAATERYKTLAPGQSEEKENLLLRRQRALNVKQGRLNRASELMSHTSYQQIGDILAEAILGKIRSKVAGGLKKFPLSFRDS